MNDSTARKKGSLRGCREYGVRRKAAAKRGGTANAPNRKTGPVFHDLPNGGNKQNDKNDTQFFQ